jgi:Fic family protein
MSRRTISIAEKQRRTRGRNPGGASSLASETDGFAERHYTVAEIAEMWNVSQDTVRRTFKDEPGVLVLNRRRRGTRKYDTLRVPASVLDRVYRRHSMAA